MILASTGAAMGAKVRVFLTFWGLQTFVKDGKRITGDNWMQKMMSFMPRPGISHRKLSKMNFLGMGPWMMRKLAKQYNVASPKELLEIAQAMGVEFMPCQMTMDMFGLKKEDLIDGLGEPVGAATSSGLRRRGRRAALHLISPGHGGPPSPGGPPDAPRDPARVPAQPRASRHERNHPWPPPSAARSTPAAASARARSWSSSAP